MNKKNTAIFTTLTFAMIANAIPLSASGNKDNDSPSQEQENSVLHVVDRPFGYGEGGGIGAGIRPEGFEEIDENLIGENGSQTVAAKMITMTGVLKAKGGKGKRKFTLKNVDGKNYAIQISPESAEELVKFKNKKIKIQGVFYNSDFLVFDFNIEN